MQFAKRRVALHAAASGTDKHKAHAFSQPAVVVVGHGLLLGAGDGVVVLSQRHRQLQRARRRACIGSAAARRQELQVARCLIRHRAGSNEHLDSNFPGLLAGRMPVRSAAWLPCRETCKEEQGDMCSFSHKQQKSAARRGTCRKAVLLRMRPLEVGRLVK